jgi:hypothetical protein
LNASSAFGAFLDPVADKLMVATVLILNGLNPVPAGPFIGNTWLFPVLACSKLNFFLLFPVFSFFGKVPSELQELESI